MKTDNEAMETIYRVSEAFSMQPRGWTVGQYCSTGKNLQRIVEETISDTGDQFECYVGYDEDGKKAFAIRKHCATVEFK